jgi:mannitol/fructose-specific phosphotransferase system IIA component (Ntr-type)
VEGRQGSLCHVLLAAAAAQSRRHSLNALAPIIRAMLGGNAQPTLIKSKNKTPY